LNAGVVIFPGSNCDRDTFWALSEVLGVKVEYLWHNDSEIGSLDLVVLPGGFSYGDYLRTGAFARFSPVMRSVADFAQRGGAVLGICNGFQILLESGLLPGAMLPNKSLRFICDWVNLSVQRTDTPFTNEFEEGQTVRIPIAHFDGNYFADKQTLTEIENTGQVVFRYSDSSGNVSDKTNPNGSFNNIAGIVNSMGNVLGMMPHPERASEYILGSSDGKKIFKSVLEWSRQR